ncbi:MAG: hypothetical protein R3C14_13335 [Caldilineaceae bacterium]
MQKRNSWMILLLLLAITLQLVGCGVQASSYKKVEPYTLEKNDTGINTVILTEKAAERIQIESAPIATEQINGDTRLVVPYGALIYDNNGGTWIYTNPEPLTYIRTAVTVDFIEGDKVYLSEGPDAGTDVAVVAVAELYGTDTGVGK